MGYSSVFNFSGHIPYFNLNPPVEIQSLVESYDGYEMSSFEFVSIHPSPMHDYTESSFYFYILLGIFGLMKVSAGRKR